MNIFQYIWRLLLRIAESCPQKVESALITEAFFVTVALVFTTMALRSNRDSIFLQWFILGVAFLFSLALPFERIGITNATLKLWVLCVLGGIVFSSPPLFARRLVPFEDLWPRYGSIFYAAFAGLLLINFFL